MANGSLPRIPSLWTHGRMNMPTVGLVQSDVQQGHWVPRAILRYKDTMVSRSHGAQECRFIRSNHEWWLMAVNYTLNDV